MPKEIAYCCQDVDSLIPVVKLPESFSCETFSISIIQNGNVEK